MALVTRTGKGSKLTIAEMDGNLEYLQNNLSGSNTITGNTDIKTTADSDAVLEISTTSSVVTQSNPRGGDITTTTQTEQIKSDFVVTINTSAAVTSEFTSSFNHTNTVSIQSSSLGELTTSTLGVTYLFASSSYDPTLGPLGAPAQINKFIGYNGHYSDATSINPIDQDNTFSITSTTKNSGFNPNSETANSGSIVLRKTNNNFNFPKDAILYIDGNQPGVNIYGTEEQALKVYGWSGFSIPQTYPTLFQVNQSGSISMPQTASAEPAWIGSDGEIVPATVGGVYYLYMWMNGAWRSGSFS